MRTFEKAWTMSLIMVVLVLLGITSFSGSALAQGTGTQPAVEDCTNGKDDDSDGKTDCADDDCSTKAMCEPCRGVVFSNDDNPTYGCLIAAALDLYSPPTVEDVRKMVGRMSASRLEAYNKRLEARVRSYCWLILDYKVERKAKLYDSDDGEYMDNDAVAELLRTEATLLDVMGIGRWNIPHMPAPKAVSKAPAKPVVKAPPVAAKEPAKPAPPVSGVVP